MVPKTIPEEDLGRKGMELARILVIGLNWEESWIEEGMIWNGARVELGGT